MAKEQAELEVSSPAESPMYGKQDEYPTAYNLEGAEYFPDKRQKEPVRCSHVFSRKVVALSVALLLCFVGAAIASYLAIEFHQQAQNWYSKACYYPCDSADPILQFPLEIWISPSRHEFNLCQNASRNFVLLCSK